MKTKQFKRHIEWAEKVWSVPFLYSNRFSFGQILNARILDLVAKLKQTKTFAVFIKGKRLIFIQNPPHDYLLNQLEFQPRIKLVMSSPSNQTVSGFQCPISFHFDPTNITHVPASASQTWISLAVVNAVTSLPTVLINLLVIWTVLENEELRSSCYYLLVAVLSLSDLLVGLVVQPTFVGLLVCIIVQCSCSCELAMAYGVPGSLCSSWTVVTMAIISLDRYLFIEHSLYYQRLVKVKTLMMITAMSCVLMGTTFLASRLLLNNSFWARQLPAILTFGPSFVIILFCVAKINLTARRQMRAIAVQQQQFVTQNSKIKEYKRSFTLGLIMVASVACLCPILILKIVGAAKGNWIDDMGFLQGTCFTFIHLQSLINPIIYSLRLSDIRSGVAKKLRLNREWTREDDINPLLFLCWHDDQV